MNWTQRWRVMVNFDREWDHLDYLAVKRLFVDGKMNPFAAKQSLIEMDVPEQKAIDLINDWYTLRMST